MESFTDLPPPRRHLPTRTTPMYQDMTELFQSACENLSLGQMVHPVSFTLQDSMACIAVGDPRMDSGVYPLPSDLIPESDRLDNTSRIEFNPHTSLNAEETIWIMDRLASCEVSFLAGAPLSQTLFTSLYFHHLTDIPWPLTAMEKQAVLDTEDSPIWTSVVLRAYLIATVKCMSITWEEMIKGNLNDGEDAILDTCQVDLHSDLHPGHALALLQESITCIQSQQRKVEPRSQTGNIFEAMLIRLVLRKNMLLIFTLFQEVLTPAHCPPAAMDLSGDYSDGMQTQSSWMNTYHQIQALCDQSNRLLNRLESSPNNPSATLRRPDLLHAPSPRASSSFDPLYARRLETAGGVPPRAGDLPSAEEMVAYSKHLLGQWKKALEILKMAASANSRLPTLEEHSTWQSLETLCDVEGMLCEEAPNCPYMRSLWQSCLCPPMNPQPSFTVDFLCYHSGQSSLHIDRLIRKQQLSGTTPWDSSFRYWLSKSDSLLSSYLLNSMTNRPRQKRHMGKMFSRWRGFADETQDLISKSDPSTQITLCVLEPMRSAVQYQSLKLGHSIILSGFDLKLYSHNEIASSYWLAFQIYSEQQQQEEEDTYWSSILNAWCHLSQFIQSHPQSKEGFYKRFKWLTLPFRDSNGNPQDRYMDLNSLWNEYNVQISTPIAVEEVLDALRVAEKNIIAQRRSVKIVEKAEKELNERLAFTLKHNLHLISTIPARRLRFKMTEDHKGSRNQFHPWFLRIEEIPQKRQQ
ncbi:unnamed protein product [Sympodiomycopsis kandeliae]